MLVCSASCLKGLNVALSTRIPCLFAPRFHGSPACSFLQATQVISLLPVQRGLLQPPPVRVFLYSLLISPVPCACVTLLQGTDNSGAGQHLAQQGDSYAVHQRHDVACDVLLRSRVPIAAAASAAADE